MSSWFLWRRLAGRCRVLLETTHVDVSSQNQVVSFVHRISFVCLQLHGRIMLIPYRFVSVVN